MALPVTPFFWKGSTRDEKLKFSRIADNSRTETFSNATDDDAAATSTGEEVVVVDDDPSDLKDESQKIIQVGFIQ